MGTQDQHLREEHDYQLELRFDKMKIKIFKLKLGAFEDIDHSALTEWKFDQVFDEAKRYYKIYNDHDIQIDCKLSEMNKALAERLKITKNDSIQLKMSGVNDLASRDNC